MPKSETAAQTPRLRNVPRKRACGTPVSSERSAVVLLEVTIEGILALLRGLPGLWPEAEVDAPPVGRGAAVQESGDELVEFQVALSERIMGAGFVVVQAAVGVDHMDCAYGTLEFLEQLKLAAGKGFLGAGLAGADGGHHVRVAGVKHHAEVGLINPLHDLNDLARLVEREAGLELPNDANPLRGCLLGASLPGLDRLRYGLLLVGRADCIGRDVGVNTQRLYAQVRAELKVRLELGNVGRLVLLERVLAMKVGGQPRDAQTGVGDLFLERSALLRRVELLWRRMRRPRADLETVETECLDLFQTFIERDRFVCVRPEDVCPGAYGDLLHRLSSFLFWWIVVGGLWVVVGGWWTVVSG